MTSIGRLEIFVDRVAAGLPAEPPHPDLAASLGAGESRDGDGRLGEASASGASRAPAAALPRAQRPFSRAVLGRIRP